MEFLIDLALMVVAAKLFSDLFERFRMPELVGSILAGVLLGPVFGIVDIENIRPFGEIGIVLLLFIAGFEEIRMEEILKHKVTCALIGVIGSLFSFAGIYLLMTYFGYSMLTALFVGAALMATSISISIASLIKTGKINSKVGRITLGSAIIDDIIGLVGLSIVANIALTGHLPGLYEVGVILFEMALFFLIFVLCCYVFPKLIVWSRFMIVEEARFSMTLVLVLLLAFLAQTFGLSSVLGAFLAGVILSRVPELETRRFLEKVNVTSEGIFIPLFFAMIGMQIALSASIFNWFTLALFVVVLASKFIPNYLVSIFSRMKHREALGLGISMMPRGEVTLIIMLLGKSLGIIPEEIFVSVVFVILVTTFLVPALLEPVLQRSDTA